MAEHIKQQYIGHYRVIRKIGTGGFAEVYLAEHIHLNTLAAIKLLTNLSAGDTQNFRDEARLIANLQHTHIIRVLDFGIEQAMPYLVMEYAPNGTMRSRHPKGTRVDLLQIVTYVKQLASALQHAHQQRLIHRDVKPDNILLGRNDELLLGDFGAALVTRTSLLLNPQNIIGTVAYMAPEQLEGRAVAASDQYALAVVVYEWLCGRCPFEGSMGQQLYMSPPSLLAQMPHLSPLVENVVMKALSREPGQRFASVQEFADAFKQASQQRLFAPSPLFLRGHNGGFASNLPTETLVAGATPPSLPLLAPTQATPPSLPVIPPTQAIAQQLPVTIMPQPSSDVQPRRSRRTFLLFGVSTAAFVAGGLLFVGLANNRIVEPPVRPKSTPAPTPVPLRSTTQYVYQKHQSEVFTAAWSPDGQYIASAGGRASKIISERTGDTAVHVWKIVDATPGTPMGSQGMNMYRGHSQVVRKVSWNHDSTQIASASEDGTVQVWHAIDGTMPLVNYTDHLGGVMDVSWSPDGTRIVSAGVDKTVKVWDANSGQTLLTFTNHQQPLSAVAWSPDGKYIASASGNDGVSQTFMVYIWNPLTGEILQSFSHNAPIGCIAWSQNSHYVVTGDYDFDDSVRIWARNSDSNVQAYSNKPVNPDNTERQIYSVAWSPDGKYFAAGSQDTQVKVWQFGTHDSREVLTYKGHNKQIMSVQWSPNGKYIASAGFDQKVLIWQIT